ncbi:response regulator transcription factor [Rhodoferax sp. PAMC 29310]|uniref:response regulator transcription factor n=1 Tax=Rhodoferax sp. PAMC 29310 TaxID=2822760 RepID=UPI001B323E15|nr:response regulator transcription factor [Rhodoferax sp. PAMC 29310]
MIRLLLVDDHPLVRDGLKARLASESDITVVGEAGNAAEALSALESCTPTLALMDIGMKDINGIELAAMLLERAPQLAVLMLSMYDSVEYAQRALQAGARGYVLKDAPASEILTALRTVANGGTYLGVDMAQRLFKAPAPRSSLSVREQDILAFLANGQSSKHIARALDLSVRTVEAHRQNIRRKLDLETQADLIKYAVEHASRHRGTPYPNR